MSETNDRQNKGPDASSGEAGSVSRRNSRGLLSFRNIAIAAIVVVGGAVAYEVCKDPESFGFSRFARTPNIDDTPAGQQLETSQRYRDNLDRQNIEGAQEARRVGGSFIATADEPLRNIDDKPAPTEVNAFRPLPPANTPRPEPQKTIVVQPRQQAAPPPSAPPAPDYNRINQLAQIMASQQQALLGAWQPGASAVTVVIEQQLHAPAEATGSGDGTASRPTSTLQGGTPPAIRAGDVVPASTIITNDSDTPGPVVAELRSGPLEGTRLIGGFEPNRANTHMLIEFKTAVLPDASQVPVSAYAVDPRQKSLAVRSDIERRYVQRYAPRLAAAFVQGLGEVLSRPGSTIVGAADTVTVTSPAATFEQGVYGGLAEVGGSLADELASSAPRGPLISLKSRQIIGVLFTGNVEQPN
ncbi:DotG/IcmE/VirB10 family protein [Nitratireductor sp. XY-223]|uniref:DotG/IcmE/VirB10 family protein n=1 Tax=Nitratireductor sp. XY-223 TaxID=2561926 RepID=UPI0010AA1BD5|nr:DotG/IcmE/VirB10 family protein [Nitratireductor sp. XY-223]